MFLNIIFTLVSVLFLNPLVDFESVNKSSCMQVFVSSIAILDHVHVTIGENKTLE